MTWPRFYSFYCFLFQEKLTSKKYTRFSDALVFSGN